MKSLIDLQIAVLADDNNGIQSYLSEIDRKTETELFQRAGQHFGFKTVIVEGKCFAHRASLATVFGFQSESGVRMQFTRNEIPSRNYSSFAQNVRSKITQELGLREQDKSAILVGWDAFLVAGMQSTTDQAKQVQKYLLEAERAARVASGVGLDIDLYKARQSKIDEIDKLSKILARIDRIGDNNAKLKQAMLHHVECELGSLFVPMGKQMELLEANN